MGVQGWCFFIYSWFAVCKISIIQLVIACGDCRFYFVLRFKNLFNVKKNL
jgi:hypothetical protein